MIGFAYVSPRKVMNAAPLRVRVQFWILVAAGVSLASVPVIGAGEGGSSVEWFSWPVISSVLLLAFNLGITWQQLAEVKRRIGDLEAESARKDVLDGRFDTLRIEIRAVRDLLERR